ncbi:hypothetical protein NQD34_015027 [Periophthalmus magnuspinnatus]|nr:hypothetical protein NQD34_015027 [Periophthalmus magnuspinnatus]
MAEDAKADTLPPASEDQLELHYRATIGSMQQRRRKNELKRLLKHTHPEITTLDKVVDKELAAVLQSEAEEAAAETGYEGEVFSKCLIFENCTTSQKGSSYSINMAQETDQTPTSVFEGHGTHSEPNKELTEEEERIDVQSTRRRFKEQPIKGIQSYQHQHHIKSQDNVYSEGKTLPDQIIQKSTSNIQESQYKTTDLHSIDLSIEQVQSENLDEDFTSIPEPETFGDMIKTSQDLFRHNPFITVNVEKEHSSFQKEVISEVDIPNVKNRKHLFESMPFDKIKQQNKDDIETMVENIRETLRLLYSANVLQSKGSIIEVHETMIATKVKFILTETGPVIMEDTVAEGGAQNFILHLLPRANVEPQIKYLKEDRDGAVRIMEVNAPVHHNHPDTEFKTANVVQLIEDILTQDNSLRKGVLIQDQVKQCAQVSVYSLYCYVDNEDIKSYCPSQQATAEVVEQEVGKSETIQKEIPQVTSGIIKSAIHCLQESQTETCTTPERPDIRIRGNVKLFRSCIEKGDMEYLKSLQAEADMIEEELPTNSPSNNANDDNASDIEYEPIDIKRLKGLFSADSIPAAPKPESCTNVSWLSSRSEDKSKKTANYEMLDKQQPYASNYIEDREFIHQAELVEVTNECEEICGLQAAISQLQKATNEAKSIHESLQERQDKHRANPTPALEIRTVTSPLKTNDSKDISTDQIYDSETKTEDEEVVLEGKLQAALQALERSNLNVARGGFEAAMIYRNSNKISSSVKGPPGETTAQTTGSCFECKPGLVEQNVGDASKEGASQNESIIEKNIKPPGPKPALPPKPEHLKANPNESQVKVPIQNLKTSGNNTEVVTNSAFLVKQANDHMEIQGTSQSKNTEKNIIDTAEKATAEQKMDKEEPDESHLNFHEACQIFGGKKTAMKKAAPVKPKRVKIADTKSQGQSNSGIPTSCNSDEQGNDREVKVTMRERKGRKETEDERRQRLSIHMDEIVRGNITAAMEIYDNLRKQEELENILIRVEEIEKDTSEVDVKSLRKVFEDVPDWVVTSNTKRNKTEGVQQKAGKTKLVKSNSDMKSPMAHVFGDLARASEEIINLKEQTLARLLDIEESIKKALYSVSNLKSESDIAGLSGLFKESLGAAQAPTSSGNISTIRIGSSRTKNSNNAIKTNENQSGDIESPKQPSPMSSPAFISISAARKTEVPPETTLCPSCRHAPKPEEKFKTTKTLKCHSPAPVKEGGQKQCPPKPKREVTVFEVQTDPKGTNKSLVGTKTITENYERTDNFGNKFYSTKTSTVLTTEPESMVKQVSTHPEVKLPVNKKS